MIYSEDKIAKKALEAMKFSNKSILLLGKAGTGKSTLIRRFIDEMYTSKAKNIAIIAPTGVAAMQIGGQTIHSFFKFNIQVTPDDARQRALWHKKQKIYQALETLVIDEISMVRADLLDCIDIFLRTARNSSLPFGGVQLIMVGDLLQLPPVVSNVEYEYFSQKYSAPYFFAADVLNNPLFSYVSYTLDTVYRQVDKDFIEVLHRIRNQSHTSDDIALINTRVQRVQTIDPGEIYIATTNVRANDVNNKMLERLSSETVYSYATIKGKVTATSYPTDDQLEIKVGAQVMFVVNNPEKGFMNGTLGQIKTIYKELDEDGDEEKIKVAIQLYGTDTIVETGTHVREIRESYYDTKEKTIKSDIVGTFEQLPIRLARACTIHKAQGKTFKAMIIDSGNGMFAPGQAYVALSRCTSLQGIKLVKPISESDIKVDTAVHQYVLQCEHTSPEDTLSQKILVFDTETTGVDSTARIVQIACALYEKDENAQRQCTSLLNKLINPGCPIPPETTAVHGISDEMVKDAPTLKDIRWDIHKLFDTADIYVAHNIAFDERILKQEAKRIELPLPYKKSLYCTMKEGVQVTRIPNNRGGYKRPKLSELYTHLWQQEITGYHDALVDVKVAAACYFKLQNEDFDPLK